MITVVWFRQDLRIADNPALHFAAQLGKVVPLFIWAPEEEGEFPVGGAARWWLQQSLAALRQDLARLGVNLTIRRGNSLATLREVIHETRANRLHWNRRYEPAIIARDRDIKTSIQNQGIEVHSFNSSLLFEPWTVVSKSGRPFQVFTPFYHHCLSLGNPSGPIGEPAKLVGAQANGIALGDLQLEPKVDWAAGIRAAWNPGENGARKQLQQIVDGPVEHYAKERDRPDRAGTSRLSPHLHWGEIGPRQIWEEVRAVCRQAGEPFLRQLVWREFAHHLLYHFPHTTTKPLRKEFERFPWRADEGQLNAWRLGRTGYPIVDAGMRELWATGWMHNRVRMVTASFLVKHLRLHWEEGAYWFWDTLVDADLANNTLGWQWSAGCGADAAPYFRIFNPVLQGEKFDPEGAYVRRWVPEIASLPNKWLHQPWNASLGELNRAAIELGKTYPFPVVDHATARREALAAWHSLRKAVE